MISLSLILAPSGRQPVHTHSCTGFSFFADVLGRKAPTTQSQPFVLLCSKYPTYVIITAKRT
jgi:hypothetical protein